MQYNETFLGYFDDDNMPAGFQCNVSFAGNLEPYAEGHVCFRERTFFYFIYEQDNKDYIWVFSPFCTTHYKQELDNKSFHGSFDWIKKTFFADSYGPGE